MKNPFKTLFTKFDEHELCVRKDDLIIVLDEVIGAVKEELPNGVLVTGTDDYHEYVYELSFDCSSYVWSVIVDCLRCMDFKLEIFDDTKKIYVTR